MLFNLSQQRCFNNTGNGREINCCSGFGPDYVIGELSAYQPFNRDGNCRSQGNLSGYEIPYEGRKNMLTNEKDENFTITELEVWSIKKVPRKNKI
jgi:hypothetical protein